MDQLLDFASIENILNQAVQNITPQQPYPYATPIMQERLYPQPMPVAHPQPMVKLPDYTGSGGEGGGNRLNLKPPQVAPTDLGLFAGLIRRVESSHNYQAKNPHTSASGAYQYINKTWNNYGGYPEARLAPRAVQDAKFNEDALGKLRKYNGDPFKMIADHMLPAQANKPWLWAHPSVIMVRGKPVSIPPVAEYVRKVIKGSPWESQFEQYLKAQSAG